MNATVTLPLAEFDRLREEQGKAEELIKATKKAALEIEVFLSFLVTRENISEYLEEFNRQATNAEIILVDGRAKIKFNETNKDSN